MNVRNAPGVFRSLRIVFSEWTTMLNLIEPLLNNLRAGFVWLDGSVPQAKRKQLVAEFQREASGRRHRHQFDSLGTPLAKFSGTACQIVSQRSETRATPDPDAGPLCLTWSRRHLRAIAMHG